MYVWFYHGKNLVWVNWFCKIDSNEKWDLCLDLGYIHVKVSWIIIVFKNQFYNQKLLLECNQTCQNQLYSSINFLTNLEMEPNIYLMNLKKESLFVFETRECIMLILTICFTGVIIDLQNYNTRYRYQQSTKTDTWHDIDNEHGHWTRRQRHS